MAAGRKRRTKALQSGNVAKSASNLSPADLVELERGSQMRKGLAARRKAQAAHESSRRGS